jgi:hypothetical protein
MLSDRLAFLILSILNKFTIASIWMTPIIVARL